MTEAGTNNRRWPAFTISVIAGFLVWYLSVPLIGKAEPWDSETPYYKMELLVAGMIAGLLPARPIRLWFWLWPAGIFCGQVAAIFMRSFTHPPIGANLFFPIGVVFLAVYSLISLFGAVPVAWALRRLRGTESHESK